MTGAPLAPTQGQLTPLQTAFLEVAAPRALRLLYGDGKPDGQATTSGGTSSSSRAHAPHSSVEAERRRRAEGAT